jgi:zinc resistance-associated protein
MNKLILSAVAAASLTISAFSSAASAAPDNPADTAPRAQAGDADYLIDARIAGMKAGLKLTPDQEKLWPAFETVVREGMKTRAENMRRMWEMHGMRDMPEEMDNGAPASPMEMMVRMSERMSRASDAMKKFVDAAKPLYDSLDTDQKQHFGPLLRMVRGGGHHGMMGAGMMRGGMMGGGGMMREGMMREGTMAGGMNCDMGRGMTGDHHHVGRHGGMMDDDHEHNNMMDEGPDHEHDDDSE